MCFSTYITSCTCLHEISLTFICCLSLSYLRNLHHRQQRQWLHQCFKEWHHITASSLSDMQASFVSRLQQAVMSEVTINNQLPSNQKVMLPHSNSGAMMSHSTQEFMLSPSNQKVELSFGNHEVVLSPSNQQVLPSYNNTKIGNQAHSDVLSIDLVRRNLFTGSSSTPSLQSGFHDNVRGTTNSEQTLSMPYKTKTPSKSAVSPFLSPVTCEPSDKSSPGSKLRILEESPSPPISPHGHPFKLSLSSPQNMTLSQPTYNSKGLSPVRPFRSKSFEADETSSILREGHSSTLLSQDVSFISVSLCECVSEEIRAELMDLDLETTERDISEGELDSDVEDTVLIWTQEATSERNEIQSYSVPQSVEHTHLLPLPMANESLLQSSIARKLIRVIHILQRNPHSKILYHWHRYTVWIRRLRSAYKSIVRSRRIRTCRECLVSWIRWHRDSASRHNSMQMMIKYSNQKLLLSVLDHWKEKTEELQGRRNLSNKKAENHRDSFLLKQVFYQWILRAEREQASHKAVQRLNSRRVAAAFNAWRTKCLADTPEMLQRANEFCFRSSVSGILSLWKERFFYVQARKMLAVEFHMNRLTATVTACFKQWQKRCNHSVTRQEGLTYESEEFQRTHLLSRSVRMWKKVHSLGLKRDEIAQKRANRALLKTALIKWKQAHESREYELSSAVHYYTQQLVLVVFQSWRRRYLQVSERADESCSVAVTFSERTMMTVAFREWRRALARRETLKMEQMKLLEKRWLIRQCNKAFGTWKLKVCCLYIHIYNTCLHHTHDCMTHTRARTHTLCNCTVSHIQYIP